MELKHLYENKATNVIFLADVHLGARANNLGWQENMKSYFYDFFMPYVKKESKKYNTILVIAGDYFENRQVIDINVMNMGIDIMKSLSEIVPVYIIIGNHDIYQERSIDINSLKIFSNMNNVHVIDEISLLHIQNDKRILLIPWVGDKKKENEILKVHKDDADIFVMHAELSGMNFDNGRPITDGVDSECIKDKMLVSGHIHTRQERGNLLYLGGPYHTKRSDMGNAKGIYNFLFHEDGTCEKIFTENTFSPIFTRLKVIDYLETPLGDIYDIVKNNYVDVVIPKAYKRDITSAKIVEALEDSGVKKITVSSEKTSDEVVKGEEHVMGKEGASIRSVFTTKLDALGFSDTVKESLEKMNEDYIAKAINELNYTEEL